MAVLPTGVLLHWFLKNVFTLITFQRGKYSMFTDNNLKSPFQDVNYKKTVTAL